MNQKIGDLVLANENLREAFQPVNGIWRQYGIRSATYDKWKATYGGLEASDVKRLKELEHARTAG